jgi:peptidyl-prolyl cis-trans isomerase D
MKTEMTMEEARRLGLPQMVLDRMMDRAAMDVQAKKLGLTVDDEAVVSTIRSLPQFQAQGGNFSRIMLQEALRQNGMTEQAFEASVRQDITRTQLIGSTINWFDIPPSMSRLLFSYLNQNRVAEYVVLTPELAGNVRAPGEAEIAAYYKANTARFSTPEYRELQYVTIGIEQFIAKVEVAEADLKKEYDTHKETYVKPEQREIEQINFPSKETADAAHDKIKSGGDFASVARGMGFSETD